MRTLGFLVPIMLAAGVATTASAQSAAPEEDTRSVRDLSTLLRINPISEDAFATLLARAEAGDTRAMMAVYSALNIGVGTVRDRDAARIWLERAAKIGDNAGALTALGNVVLVQDDDPDAAIALWRLAADKGSIGALRRLAQNDPIDFGTRLQTGLAAKGESVGDIDGIIGPLTLGALASYMDGQSLDATVCLDDPTTAACLQTLSRAGLFASGSD